MKSSRLIAERTALIMLPLVAVVKVGQLAANLSNAHKIALPRFAALKVQTSLSRSPTL